MLRRDRPVGHRGQGLRGPNHGYAIARAVERDSSEALRLGEGTLDPVLRSLEQDELVISEWETVEVGPARKVYRITVAGRAECARRVAEGRQRVTAIGAVRFWLRDGCGVDLTAGAGEPFPRPRRVLGPVTRRAGNRRWSYRCYRC